MCITATDTLSIGMMSCLYHLAASDTLFIFTFPGVLFSRMYLSELGNSRFTMSINTSEIPFNEWAAPICPEPSITMRLCHQCLLSGHGDHNMVMAGAGCC